MRRTVLRACAALLPLLAAWPVVQAQAPASSAPPRRIVSLMPSLTETVCALGECERLVGVDRYSSWPARVERLRLQGVQRFPDGTLDVDMTGHKGNLTDVAAAVGLGLQLWIPGVVLWIIGHSLAVWGARVDPQFMQVFARHIKHKPLLDV